MKSTRFLSVLWLSIVLLFNQISIAQIGIKDPKTGQLRPLKSIGIAIAEYSSANYVRPESPLSKSEIAAMNKPATVKVYAIFNIQLSYAEPSFFSRFLLQREAMKAAELGLIPNTPDAKFEFVLQTLRERPSDYLQASLNYKNMSYSQAQMGSGMFITSDGYILTNAHVVDLNVAKAKNSAVIAQASAMVDEELTKHAQYFGITAFNQDLVDQTAAVITNNMAQFVKIGDVATRYEILTGKTISDPSYRLPAVLISKGAEIPGKDVAILKTQIINAPTVALGKASDLDIGDDLYLLGYPGVIDNHSTLSQDKLEEPTFGSGSASSWQTVNGGAWRALGFDGNAGQGNSGGPVFNKYGEVIGLLTFGTFDELDITFKQGFNFIVPSTVFAEFINSAKVQPSLGSLDIEYRKAMKAYDKDDYSTALTLLTKIRELQPDWPYINEYINKCQSKGGSIASDEKNGVGGKLTEWLDVLKTYGVKWYLLLPALFLLGAAIKRRFS